MNIINQVITPNSKLGLLFDFTSLVNSNQLSKVIDQLYELLKGFNTDAIIGSGYGGAQLCGALTAKYGIPSIIVRSSPHQKQNNRQIEGDIQTPRRLVIIDDAIFSGQSIKELLTVIGFHSSKIVGCAVIYDDWRPLGTRQLEQKLFPVRSILSRRSIGLSRDASDGLTYAEVSSALIDKPVLSSQRLLWADYNGNKSHWVMKSSPLIYQDLLINAVDDYRVAAYKLLTGELRWEVVLPGRSFATSKGITQDLHVSSNGVLYVGAYDGSVTALNPLSGEIAWQRKIGSNIHATPKLDKQSGLLFVNVEAWQIKANRASGYLTALDPATGDIVWAYQHAAFPPGTVTLAGRLVIAAANDHTVSAFDTRSGELQWTFVASSTVKGSGLVIGEFVYIIDCEGQLYKLALADGSLQWSVKGSSNGWMETPIELNGNIIVWDSTGKHQHAYMYAYDMATGERKYLHKYRSPTASVIKLTSTDALVFGSGTHVAYIREDKKLWELNAMIPGCTLASNPALSVEHKLISFNTMHGGLQTYTI